MQLESLEERRLLTASPTITWPQPDALTFGTLLSGQQLSASADVPGTFQYYPPVGARLNPGNDQPLTVTFTPQDDALQPVSDLVRIDVMPSMTIRPIDGSFSHPDDLGIAGTPHLRQLPAAYEDGIAEPRGGDPSQLANPREISSSVHAQGQQDLASRRHLSRMVYQFGQFLDHDITLTPESEEAFPIPVPAGDADFDPFGTGTQQIPLLRSAGDPSSGTSTDNPREQMNMLTSFIDGSVVYGSDNARADALRTGSAGKLIISAEGLLPLNGVDTPLLENANATGLAETDLFVAGDKRANEQIGLTAMHTLFVREHNHWAERIAAESFSGQDLSDTQVDEDIYQQARRIVSALLQVITYNEFVPMVIGEDALPEYQGFDAGVDPRMSNVFATAAFRVGHTMLPDELTLMNEDGQTIESRLLADSFFRPDVIVDSGVDSILLGLAMKPQQEIDAFMVDGVRNMLFGPPGAGGMDLAALNIQRGREHGLPTYNETRQQLGLPRAFGFFNITSDPDVQNALASVYQSVDDVDLWVGGIIETHLPQSSLGETFTRIWVDQFTRLRDGDQYFYRNQTWDDDLLSEIEGTTLSDIMLRNTNIQSLPENVFQVATQDFGDAPSGITLPIYPTMISNDGPRHAVGTLMLGTSIDGESDGQPSAGCDGDGDDEDGVVPMADLVTVSDSETISSVSVETSQAGRLDAWIDFNRDGDFDDIGEQILHSNSLDAGSQMISFVVPAGADHGDTVARFRLSQTGGLAPTGPASDGEVEDYMITVLDADQAPAATVDVSAGWIDLSLDSETLVARASSTDQFAAPLSGLGSISVVGAEQNDAVVVRLDLNRAASQLADTDVAVHVDGGAGENALELAVDNIIVDLTDSRLQVSAFQTLDLSPEGAATLIVDAAAISQLAGGSDSVMVVGTKEDVLQVDEADRWRLAEPVVREGRFLLAAHQLDGDAILQADLPRPWQNFLQAGDVTNDGKVTASDALRIINELHARQFSSRESGDLIDPLAVDSWQDVYFDHSGDGRATALDALRVINELSLSQLSAEAEWTGRPAAALVPWSMIDSSQEDAALPLQQHDPISSLNYPRLPDASPVPIETAEPTVIDADSFGEDSQLATEAVDELLSDAKLFESL